MSNLDSYSDREYEDYICMFYDCPNSKRNGNENMDKKFSVMIPNNLKYKTYEEAEAEAKRCVSRQQQDYVIVQAIALANTPTPDVSVTKL